MKNDSRFATTAGLALALALTAGIPATTSAATSKSHAAPKAKAEPAKPAGEVVQYADLESRVGQEIVIETKFHTTRRGKLTKWTQPTLELDIGTDGNPIEFTVPKETIKSIIVVTPDAEPAKDAGTSGAKKN